jgi:glycosyltransferase involved in cell wall biosynthesis
MSDSAARLSVIIASYNRADLLPDCIASLRNGGVPDLRIIVVDDGSRDNTREVVASLGGSDIDYIYQENKGLSGARNTGIRAATTPYICYLDSDDYWLPGVAAPILDMLDRHPEVGAIFTEARVGNPKDGYYSWKESAGTFRFDELPFRELEPGLRLFEGDSLYKLMVFRNAVFTGAIIQRRELILRAGLFDPELKATGDYELWMRALPLAPFAHWPEPLAIYTRHETNMTNDQDLMQHAFCDTLIKHAAKNTNWYHSHKALFDQALREHLFYFGYLAYQRGDYALARRRFRDGLRQAGFDARLAAYWAATCLPRPALAALRRLRQVFP